MQELRGRGLDCSVNVNNVSPSPPLGQGTESTPSLSTVRYEQYVSFYRRNRELKQMAAAAQASEGNFASISFIGASGSRDRAAPMVMPVYTLYEKELLDYYVGLHRHKVALSPSEPGMLTHCEWEALAAGRCVFIVCTAL